MPSESEFVTREVLIRLKPLTESSRELIAKEKKKICLLQFRLKVLLMQQKLEVLNPDGHTATILRYVPAESSSNKTLRDIIRIACQKWNLRQR